MGRSAHDRAIALVERHGVVVVYPIPGRTDPPSLWAGLWPRTPMRWDWSAEADPKVAALWHLRERLSRTNEVVYAKWIAGRATFFERRVFTALLRRLDATRRGRDDLSPDAADLLDLLREDSPRTTRALRAAADQTGRENEARFQQALRELFAGLLVVGRGETADGAGFPALSVAATELVFEDLWEASRAPDAGEGARLDAVLAASPAVRRALATAQRARRRLED